MLSAISLILPGGDKPVVVDALVQRRIEAAADARFAKFERWSNLISLAGGAGLTARGMSGAPFIREDASRMQPPTRSLNRKITRDATTDVPPLFIERGMQAFREDVEPFAYRGVMRQGVGRV
jgi:hypothetical protein